MTVATSASAVPAEESTIPDRQGNPIGKGTVVQVIAPNLRAYQVPPKAFGSFNDQGKFVPQSSKRYLEIPIGLMGTVTKVYTDQNLSANLPIQVKFEPGAFPEANVDPPLAFLMHFTAKEVELVA